MKKTTYTFSYGGPDNVHVGFFHSYLKETKKKKKKKKKINNQFLNNTPIFQQNKFTCM